ncbi:MAG TPA: DNA adenine methylase [Chitinophagaceae bacterium]|nr:DNA adenine methylase [Chitinophagaceae bacterium]
METVSSPRVQQMPVKPFLKWAGGKRQLLPYFRDLYPPALKEGRITHYYEPFAGSGAVFFDIVQRYNIQQAFLTDINADLVLTYRIIQRHTAALIEALWVHQKKYLALSAAQRAAYFYAQRELFNKQAGDKMTGANGVARAAQLIFLNRTCYNGLFRVNASGAFNTPVGDYKKPVICDEANLLAVAQLLHNVRIRKMGYAAALKQLPPGSFVYLDPPYRPLSQTARFTAYDAAGFGDAEQARLAQVCRNLDAQGLPFMLCNSATADGFFEKLYKGFTLQHLPARRLINAHAGKRGPVNEIVVTNYTL